MTLNAQILNVDAMKVVDGYEFCRHVSNTLARYDVRSPGFNMAAGAGNMVTPYQRGLFMYPEEARELITVSLQALKEYEQTREVSRPTRERFVLEDTKDRLRNVEGDHLSPEYREMYDKTMAFVASRMTGVESLVLAPAVEDNGFSIKPQQATKPPKPPGS